jgi:formate hydrogenlyase subunit 3/multisubunit Na+/H+ antiporter MnhD subunit
MKLHSFYIIDAARGKVYGMKWCDLAACFTYMIISSAKTLTPDLSELSALKIYIIHHHIGKSVLFVRCGYHIKERE